MCRGDMIRSALDAPNRVDDKTYLQRGLAAHQSCSRVVQSHNIHKFWRGSVSNVDPDGSQNQSLDLRIFQKNNFFDEK